MSADNRPYLMAALEDCISVIETKTKDPTYQLARMDYELSGVRKTGLELLVETTVIAMPKIGPGVGAFLDLDLSFTLNFYDNGPYAVYYSLEYKDTYKSENWYTRDELTNLSTQIESNIRAIVKLDVDLTNGKESDD